MTLCILAIVALAEVTPPPQPPRPAYWWAGPVHRTIIKHRETPKDDTP